MEGAIPVIPPSSPTSCGEIIALQEDIEPQTRVLSEEICVIGRSHDCHIIIPRQTVSRLHAQIERRGPRYIIQDTESVNGTFVNGAQIHAPRLLHHQDQIGLGDAAPLLTFLDPDPTIASTRRLRYDESMMAFFIGSERVDLTPAQLRLLRHFHQHAGEVCTRESCAEALWGRDYEPGMDAAALDRALSNLRRRLREYDPDSEWIQTRRGAGYVLVD